MRRFLILLSLLLLTTLAAGCGREEEPPQATPLPPTPTGEPVPTATTSPPEASQYVTVATDAPYAPFGTFDEFGNVVGFDAEIVDNIMARTGYDYEFVVTNFEGMLQSVADGEFDMAVSALTRPDPVPGIAYSDPYLEVGQVLVVLANEQEITSHSDIPPGVPIGVLADSLAGNRAAEQIAGIPDSDLVYYDSVGQALLALREGEVAGVIIDHDDAEHYTRTHYEQLKIVGGSGSNAWITHQSYYMAVDTDHPSLLEEVNEAIAQAKADGTIERITRNWLVSKETVDMGESLIGTPNDIIVIGVVGQLDNVDPAAAPDTIGWEVKGNTMSGLFMFDAEDNLVPVLADGMPEVSDDGLEYTFTLRSDLTFPDGSPLTAEDVRWSLTRAAALGNWHVNAFLKDDDGDAIADADAVEVLGANSVKLTLKQPASYFLNVLATPPYFIVSQSCYESDPEPARNCNGIGKYEIIEWKPNESIQLQVNPQWPGETAPAFENIQIRFYEDAESLRTAMELSAIDVAWTGMPQATMTQLLETAGIRAWEGPANFKSYLVFRQSDAPWENVTVRQAVAYAIDREALAREVFGGRRQPLYSPLPDSVPEQVATEPERDLERAQELLRLAGYSLDNRLTIPLWYLNDGRYTPLEEAYATAIERQLEATGLIQVELNGASWDVFSVQMTACNYPTFLLGWPPVGWPTRYPAAMGWIEHFVTETDTLCSNYQSLAMDTLIDQVRRAEPGNLEAQEALYVEIQERWAEEYPTLDLTQSRPQAIAWDTVDNVQFDRMGLLHYETLIKRTGEQ